METKSWQARKGCPAKGAARSPLGKKVVRAALAALLALLLLAMPAIGALRPKAISDMLRREETPWTGVLSLAVVPTFLTGGSIASYANAVVKAFERANPGVLVTVSEMTPHALGEAIAAGTAPDVLLFGSGAVQDAAALMPLTGDTSRVRDDLLASASCEGKAAALPVAAGGYVLIAHGEAYRASGAAGAETWQERLSLMGARSVQCARSGYTFPLAALVATTDGAVLTAQDAVPANVGAFRRELSWPDFALEGKTIAYLATPYEISRMRALEAGGRVASWETLPFQGQAYTDMVLYAGVVRPEFASREGARDNAHRSEAAGALLGSFLEEGHREALMKTGLVPSTGGEPLYDNVPGLEMMEASLQGELIVPNAFSQRTIISDAGDTLADAARYLQGLTARGGHVPLVDTP